MPDAPAGAQRAPSPILKLVCDRCVQELGMAHTAIALASDDGLWTPAYATSAVAADLEQHAFTVGEGPCFDALRRHAPVLVADLDTESEQSKWPIWAPMARAAGVRSVAAFPIQSGAIEAGVLTLLSAAVDRLHGARLASALRLADSALLGLLDLVAGLEPEDSSANREVGGPRHATDQREFAAVVRAEVHQAAGMIMVQAGVSIEQALVRLRARAYESGRPITEVAADVLARRLRFGPPQDPAE